MRNLLIILFCFFLPSLIFSQEKKIALVIGISNYQNGAPLANPVNDAEDIGKKLEAAGFNVSLHTDLGQTDMKKVIDEFGRKLDQSDIGLFFYAGHGVQAKGINYLIPVDAELKTENDVEYNCVDAGRILAKMEDASTSTNIVILDACRTNPFERSWSRNSNGNGLANMEAPGGSLIAYSTAPGRTASDGYYRNSPFTAGLLEYIGTPNLTVEALFKLVRIKVFEKTGGQQVPWEHSSLMSDFYFNADIDKTQTTLNDILPDYTANSPEPTDYESLRQIKAAGIRSLAVMPFANYTGDDTREYLAMGLQDALITELSQLGLIHVTSQTSTLSYIDFRKTVKEIAGELNVDGVIETTLIGIDENIRIQLKMYSVDPEERLVWSQFFDSDMSDIFNLYNKVIKNIAYEIQLSLSPDQEKELEKSSTIDPKAYEAYLKGKYYWEKLSQESMHKTIDYFEQAIELEPEWADPYAGLANAWSTFGTLLRSLPQSTTIPLTNKYLNKALELDPNSGQAHYVKAIVAVWTEFDWEKGEKEFLKSLEINPNNALCRTYYSHLLAILRRNDEALVQADLALHLDPFKPLVLRLHGNIMFGKGDHQSAIRDWEKAISIEPDTWQAEARIHDMHMRIAFAEEDYEKWILSWEKKVGINGNWKKEGIDAVVRAYHKKGHLGAIKEMFRMNKKYGDECNMSNLLKAERYIVLKEYDKAIDCLEESYERRDMGIAYILTGNLYDQMKDHPRFIELLRKMNLYDRVK